MLIKPRKLLLIVNVDYFLISHRLEIALAALKEGFEVHLAAKNTGRMDEIRKFGIYTHDINLERSSTKINSILDTMKDIKKVINRVDPSILHFISIKPVILGGIVMHFIKKEPLIISSISGLGQIYISTGFIGFIKKFVINILYSIAFFHKKIIVIFQNKSDLNLISSSIFLPLSKTRLINGSGVDLKKFKFSPIPIGKPIILFSARLIKSKGVIDFVDSAKAIGEKARFVICGKIDYESKDHISQELLNYWIESGYIEYLGFSDNMEDIVKNSSIVVLPSYREGLPKSLCEAAACGRPVITTNVPGCRDAIIPNKTGFLVELRNKNQLVEKIKILINNPKLAEEMSINARKLAENKFDRNKIVEDHLGIYREFN
tara:strand:+ start:1592 stop:2716 length:1125 start_codon:yes stop_codon:yes gene_type:complete